MIQYDKVGKAFFILCIGILGATTPLFLGVGAVDAARSDIAAPTSPSPANNATAAMPVTFQWSPVTFPGGLSGGYVLELTGPTLSSDFKDRMHWASTNSFPFSSVLLVGTEHSWRVRACLGFNVPSSEGVPFESQCGPWSNNGVFWKFTAALAKPKLLSPANTTKEPISSPVTLQWEKVLGADTYNIEVRNLTDPFTRTFDKVASTSFAITPQNFPLNLNHAFQWKVIPLQGAKQGPVSDTWEFFIALAKPTLLTPENGEDVPYPFLVSQFTWSPVSGATKYIVEVFDAGNTRVQIINKIGEVYSWQVTACEKENVNCGPPSSRSNFTLVFAAPVIIAPTDKQEITIPFQFSWRRPEPLSREGLYTYLWEIVGQKSGAMTNMIGINEVKLTLTEKDVKLKPGTHTFRVKACTQDNKGCSDWSERTFTIPDNEAPKIEQFDVNPKAPAWVNQANPRVTISWSVSDTGGSGLKQIALQVAPDNNGSPGAWQVVPGKGTIAPVTKTVSDSPSGGDWWYRILVLDGKLNEAFSSPLKVQVDKTSPLQPTCLPGTQKFLKSVLVTCSAEAGVTIYYTLDKQAPTRNSSQYREPLTFATTTTTTLTVAAWDLAGNRSQAPDNSYTYTLEVLPDISISPKPDEFGTVVFDFGKVEVGASKEKSLRVTNNTPSDIAVSLPLIPEPFSWEKSAIIIAKGETQVFSVKFTPQRVDRFGHDVNIEFRDLTKEAKPLLRLITLALRGEVVDTQPSTIQVGHSKIPNTETIVINAGAQDIVGVKKITISLGVGGANPGPLETETICFDSSRAKCVTTAAPVGPWSNGTKIVYYATAEDLSGNITKSAEQRFTAGEIPDTSTSAPTAPTGIFGVADRAVNVAFTALLIAASLFILLAAFQFVAGGGNPEQISQARDKLVWAAAGIAIALVSKGVAVILKNILLGPSGEGPAKITCPPPPAGGIPNPLSTFCFSGLLDSIINVIFTLSFIVVPFVVIYAGFLFVTGGGNPEQITKARNTLIWTAVGFIVILVAKGLPFILRDILGI